MYFTLFYLIELHETFVFKWLPGTTKTLPVKNCISNNLKKVATSIKTLVLAALWSVGSRVLPHFVFLRFYRLYEVCDSFNRRSPRYLRSLKVLFAISDPYVMITSITFVRREEDETTSPTFCLKFNRQIGELILLRECNPI